MRKSKQKLIFCDLQQIIAVYRSLNDKDMNLTLKAFYYLAIQLYITTAFYSSINRTNELRQFFQLLEENILQRRRELIGFQRKRLFLVF